VQTNLTSINIDDAVLVEKCRAGDNTAMERLIIKYQDRIYNVILKICGNRDDAVELAQDTFVKAIENISSFQGRSGFYTWLFRIAVNLTLNYCKRQVKLPIGSLDAELDSGSSQAKGRLKQYLADESSLDPARLVENRELCELVIRALDRLSNEQKAVVVLRDIEGMNYEQIAGVLDIQLGTVKSRLSRARNNLKKILETVLK